jgi:hypothetical protein
MSGYICLPFLKLTSDVTGAIRKGCGFADQTAFYNYLALVSEFANLNSLGKGRAKVPELLRCVYVSYLVSLKDTTKMNPYQ